MLVTMGILRLVFGWPTPTELIFDRLFPFLTVEFFISSLVKAGGYTPLKLQGVYGALAGQVGSRSDRRSYLLVVPESTRSASTLGQRRSWNYRRARVAVDRAGGASGDSAVRNLAVADVDHELSWAAAGAGANRRFTRNVDFVQCLRIWHHAFPRAAFGALRTAAASDRAGVRTTGRRRFLAVAIGAALAVAFNGLLRRLYQIGTFSYDGRQYGGPGVQKITPIRPRDEFYQVSKNLIDPMIVRDSWRLDIVGQVENPQVYSFADIAAMPAVEQETTLLCISYGIGSGLCSNAIWKGVPLPRILAQVKPKPNVTTVLFRAADGYYETFRFEKAMEPTTLVAYEMNGEPLPQGHGFPLRLIVPGLYGEKNPKWLTRIELLDEADARLHRRHGCGFYKQQGWGRLGDIIPTHSRFDAPQVAGNHFAQPFILGKTAELRGMAFGGDRGISKVEISTDDSETWEAAEISQPGTKISWSLWRYEWTPKQAGESQLVVRATDGEGKLQISEYRDQVPDGATGLHRVRANVVAS